MPPLDLRWTLGLLSVAIACGRPSREPEPRGEPLGPSVSDPAEAPPTAPNDAPPSERTPTPAVTGSADGWSPLSIPVDPPTTPDGIPIVTVSLPEGARWDVTPAWDTLTYAQQQASDGVSTFVAVREHEGTWSDVVIRGGELRTNVLRRLAAAPSHPGGCGAVSDGTMLLSAPVPNDAGSAAPSTVQAVWVTKADGTLVRHVLPADAESSTACKGVVDGAGRFSLFTGPLVEHDGEGFELDRVWQASRTFLTEPLGPRYCFSAACSEQERAGTQAALVAALEGVLGECYGYARYAAAGDIVAARCSSTGTAVRVHVSSGKVETMAGLPVSHSLSDGLLLTRDGHMLIELAMLMRRYQVWPVSSNALSPWRSLELDEVLARTSPTLLLRGLPEPIPPVEVGAVLLGAPLPFDAVGVITRANTVLERGPSAHAARSARATAVLPPGDVVLAHEAAVELQCGAYVRAPVGHEGEPLVHDFDPPTMPALSPRAVHVPSPCLPLTEVHALPGMPELLLAKTADGRLATAWLPPPLPLPEGGDRRRVELPPGPPAAPPEPRPGSGWVVHGAIDSIEGLRATPAPGTSAAALRGWQQGGAAVLQVDGVTIVVSPGGAWTVPSGTTAMAIQREPTPVLYGALGPLLVVCGDSCRTLDPGDGRDIVGVMPRTRAEVILGFGEQRDQTAVYRVPSTGGAATPAHALVATLQASLRARPAPAQ